MPCYKGRVGSLWGLIAFALLWLFLAGFFAALFRGLVRRARDVRAQRGDRGDPEQGL
jgi:hypothetical protein